MGFGTTLGFVREKEMLGVTAPVPQNELEHLQALQMVAQLNCSPFLSQQLRETPYNDRER
jgi:hypothetical protein